MDPLRALAARGGECDVRLANSVWNTPRKFSRTFEKDSRKRAFAV